MSALTIDEFLESVTPNQRAALETLRGQIRAAAPEADECISYGQPAFRRGRVICGFGATKKHCAPYLFSGTILDAFDEDLDGLRARPKINRSIRTPERPRLTTPEQKQRPLHRSGPARRYNMG